MEDLDPAARTTPYDHPVLATLAGIAVLVLGALLLPRLMPQQPLETLLAAGAGLGLVLWGVGFAVTTRYSTLAWKLGSVIVLVAAGLGSALIAHSQYETIARADASSFAEVEFGPGGAIQLPAGVASRGPLSKLFADGVTADAQAQRDFGTAFGKLGVGNLASPYLLQQDPKALAQCAAIGALRSQVEADAAARVRRAGAMTEALSAANLPARAKQGIAIMARAQPADTANDPARANHLAMIDETGALCQLLAKRGWFNNGGYFGFRSGGDESRFRELSKHRIALAGEAERIDRAAQARVAEGREMVRDVLGKSIFVQ